MYQSLFRIAILPAALIPLMAQSALSFPQTEGSYYSSVPIKETDQPVCYLQTIDGRTLDLSNMCQRDDSKNRQLQQSQLTGQPCSYPDACTNSFDSSQQPPPAVYIPTGSPK